MYCLIDFCCICFCNKEHLKHLSDTDSENITYCTKLMSCVTEMCFNEINDQWLVCNECCETMDASYKFRQKCLNSKTTITDYITHIRKIRNINGAVNVYLNDINKFCQTKQDYETENNVIYTKISSNEGANGINFSEITLTSILRGTTPTDFKLIDSTHNCTQFEKVVIKMEPEDQYFEEHVEQNFNNLLVNHDNINLTRTIKIENQDSEIPFQANFENILETCYSENEDVETKINENPLNLDKCIEGPSNLNEIKVDIVDNDIESVNSDANFQFKREDIDETSMEDVNTLEEADGDDTDDDTNCLEKPYKCSVCQKKFSASLTLRLHMKIHTTDQLPECSVCHKKYPDSSSLRKHMKTHKGKKAHQCIICLKKYTESSTLKKHMRTHTGEKPYECGICKKKFTMSSRLTNHIRIHTGEKPHECGVCTKKFTESSTLRKHMKIHTGEKQHECILCRKRFTDSSTLRKHLKIHSGEKPYECFVCQKKFTESSTVKKHMKIHTGEKLHECSVCKKKFRMLSGLINHIRIHTGEKPHACSICEKKFTDSSTLRKHVKIHSGEKAHQCVICLKRFRLLGHISRHMRCHAGKVPVPE